MLGKLFSLLITAATLANQVFGQEPIRFSKRDIQLSSILDYRGAVLLVNKKQTSCEAALIDSGAAFVAASCLKYSGSTVDTTNNLYELMIKLGSGNDNSQKVSISNVYVHPKYDPNTYINNVAVVQFNVGSDVTWQEYIAVNPSEWDDEYFSRRSLIDSYSTTWNNVIAFSSMTTPSDCATASKVYSANTGDFLCNYAASLSIYNRDCKVPYGTVYAVVQPDDFGVAALYSHSAIYGDSMCSSQKKLHYYTVLRNYIPWASRQIGRSVGGFSRDSSFELATNYDYSMTAVSSAAVSGVKVFSGDRYSQDPANPSLADPSPPPETSASASAKNSQSSNETNPPATSSAANSKESPKPSNSNEGEGAQASAHVGNSSQQSNNGASTGASNNSNSGKSDSNSSASATDSQSGNTDIEPSESETAGLSATDKANNSGENNASNKEGDKGGASKTIIIVAIVVVLLLAAGGGIWYLWKRKRNRNRSIAEKNGWETRNSVRSAASSMQLGSQYLGHSGRDSPGLARRGSNTRSDIIRAYSGDNDRDSGRYSGGFRDSSYPAFNTQGTTNMHIGSMGGYSGQTRNGGYHNGGPSNYYQQGNGRSQYKTDSMDSNNF